MLTNKQKHLLKEFTRFYCEECHKKYPENELTIHHIRRQGGDGKLLPPEILHSFRNLKVISKEVSKQYHFKEQFR